MPSQLHIPELKDIIELAEDWTFTLHEESRNVKLIAIADPAYPKAYEVAGPSHYGMRNYRDQRVPMTWEYTFPAGTALIVDRIYVRAGASAYSSVTFRTKMGKRSIRFWAKLKDVNKIVMV